MSTLNIINKSPFEKRTLEQCLPRTAKGDSVLLIEDATVAAISNAASAEQLSQRGDAVRLYVLAPDLAARGLADKELLDGITTVDYAGFVDLVAGHDRVHSWL